MEERKQKEAEFHNRIRQLEEKGGREYEYFSSNRKFYSITRGSEKFFNNYILQNCRGKRVLDYCCGDGKRVILLAKNGAEAIGIDISKESVERCNEMASREKLKEKANCLVMDAEKLEFKDNYFDLIICTGVLHHLDIKKALQELSRVLRPEGFIISVEPLVYNPIFQLYRRMTPHLRTKWETEHILSKKDLDLAKNYFGKMDLYFFHLATLIAVPIRNFPIIFNPFLTFLEYIDSILLKLPFIKWLSWQVVFILSNPKKEN